MKISPKLGLTPKKTGGMSVAIIVIALVTMLEIAANLVGGIEAIEEAALALAPAPVLTHPLVVDVVTVGIAGLCRRAIAKIVEGHLATVGTETAVVTEDTADPLEASRVRDPQGVVVVAVTDLNLAEVTDVVSSRMLLML